MRDPDFEVCKCNKLRYLGSFTDDHIPAMGNQNTVLGMHRNTWLLCTVSSDIRPPTNTHQSHCWGSERCGTAVLGFAVEEKEAREGGCVCVCVRDQHVRLPGSGSPFRSQVDVAAETEAFASPTPKPCNTAWVAREPERLEAKAWREKKRSEGLSREHGSLL